MAKVKKNLLLFLLVLYCAAMIYILFLRSAGKTSPYFYWESLPRNFNLIPFANLYGYLTAPAKTTAYTKLILENIVGNVLIFIPAGVFLPLFLPKCRRFSRFMAVLLLTVVLVELTQLFSLLGMCDMDDLILNALGGIIGFRIWKTVPIQRFCKGWPVQK